MLRPYLVTATIGYGAGTHVPRQVMTPVTEVVRPRKPTLPRRETKRLCSHPRWGNATKANPPKGGDAKLSRLTPAPLGARHAGRAAERTPGGHLAYLPQPVYRLQHHVAVLRRRPPPRPVRLP